jgi:DNA-binding NarL/FixJ family response regulator
MDSGRVEVSDQDERERNEACALCGSVPAGHGQSPAEAPAWFVRGYQRLTAREREVAMYVGRGLHNRDIATLLGTAPDTVRKQTVRIYEKVCASGRFELAIWMIIAGYVT